MNDKLKALQEYCDKVNSGEIAPSERKTMNEFLKGVLCLGISVILFLLADYLEINSFKDLF